MDDLPGARTLRLGQEVRYSKKISSTETRIGGRANFHHLFRDPHRPDQPSLLMESGIAAPTMTVSADGMRRAVLFARTSRYKAGSSDTPWHDEYDLQNGRVHYFGDHKPSTIGPLGTTLGNQRLRQVAELQGSTRVADRRAAPPVLVFRFDEKGSGTFCGVGVIVDLTEVAQRDTSGTEFRNLAAEMAVLDTGVLDLRWIDDRRDPRLTVGDTLRYAPLAWKLWTEYGSDVLREFRLTVP